MLREILFPVFPVGKRFALDNSEMKVTTSISFLLAFLGDLHIVSCGDQIALRTRPKNPILSRSIASDGSMFDPTDEESFYISGGKIETTRLGPPVIGC